ncbi:MAG: hypothetical protein IJV20_10265 [Prevotella sp.]|nr:hypothetical protein [Prevotella sp.]
MKKIQLQNMQALNNRGQQVQMMIDESGNIIDDSGLIDDSGSVEEPQYGYEYVYATMESISIRYVIIWERTKNSATASIALDDGTNNPYASGFLGEQVCNTDEDHFELVHYQLNTSTVTGTGSFSASWTMEYIHYPLGKSNVHIKGGEPKDRFASGIIAFTIPAYVEDEDA